MWITRALDNFRMLDNMGAKTLLRCPVIPGVNDREAHFAAIAALANRQHVTGIELEPYHRWGFPSGNSWVARMVMRCAPA